jgi:hypothetical protein
MPSPRVCCKSARAKTLVVEGTFILSFLNGHGYGPSCDAVGDGPVTHIHDPERRGGGDARCPKYDVVR